MSTKPRRNTRLTRKTFEKATPGQNGYRPKL